MVLGGSCPGGNCPGGSCPRGVIALGGSCPWGSCPQGSCPRGSCPRGSCPVTVLVLCMLRTIMIYGCIHFILSSLLIALCILVKWELSAGPV